MIDWDIVLIAACAASVFMVAGIMFQKWLDATKQRPVKYDGNLIGDYIEYYCKVTKLDIDKVVVVERRFDDESIYSVDSLDKYPEVWMGDD